MTKRKKQGLFMLSKNTVKTKYITIETKLLTGKKKRQ